MLLTRQLHHNQTYEAPQPEQVSQRVAYTVAARLAPEHKVNAVRKINWSTEGSVSC